MDPRNPEQQNEPEEPRYLNFRHLPEGTMRDGKLALNRYSSTLTNGHDFPGAQVLQNSSTSGASTSAYKLASSLGHAIRSRCAVERSNEDAAACRHRECLVGG